MVHISVKVADVYLSQTWKLRSHAVSACIGLWRHRLMHAHTACIVSRCHRPMHAVTAWVLLLWFHFRHTFTSATLHFCGPILNDTHFCQSSWSNGISEINLKLKIPCCYCMYWPVTSQADAWTSQANACMYCMHCPMMSQTDACSYSTGSVVLISSQIYLYL